MNTDFRVDVGFLDHHKTRRLYASLGPDAVLSLLRLWAFAAVNKPTGNLDGMTDLDVAAAAGWPCGPHSAAESSKPDLVAELVRLRFLRPSSHRGRTGYVLNSWDEHQPFVINAPKRREQTKKAAEARWNKAKPDHAERIAPSNTVSNAPRNAPPEPPKPPEPALRAKATEEANAKTARARPSGPEGPTDRRDKRGRDPEAPSRPTPHYQPGAEDPSEDPPDDPPEHRRHSARTGPATAEPNNRPAWLDEPKPDPSIARDGLERIRQLRALVPTEPGEEPTPDEIRARILRLTQA